MKKLIFTGIVILLAVFFVTCEEWGLLNGSNDDVKIEWTDVEYSEDGSMVTIYLDGSKPVPVTKKSARAMSTRLGKMAYDYLEVIFIGPAGTTVARSQWELGQSAGISGVARGVAPAGIDYKFLNTVLASAPAAAAPWVAPAPAAGTGVALMAVGRKDGKTLLGIGQIGHVDTLTGGLNATGFPNAPVAVIAPSTQSVTFYIEAVKTGLLVGAETIALNDYGILKDSLAFTTTSIKTDAKRSTLGGIDYPLYSLPEGVSGATEKGTYTFDGAPVTYKGQLLLNRFHTAPVWGVTAKSPLMDVEMRIPRYMEGGRYLQPKSSIDMRSTVESLDYGRAPLNLFDNVVDLTFKRAGTSTGLYSFYLDIPVVLMTKIAGTNGGSIQPIVWHIRTGLGSELYSIDDGLASGGCVLMGYGVSDLDMLEINWEFLN